MNNDAPPFCKQTAFMMSFQKLQNSFVFDASLVHGVMFLKASLHGLKRQRGGWGGGVCKHNVVMTGSERVHVSSVFAGKKIPEAMLHS